MIIKFSTRATLEERTEIAIGKVHSGRHSVLTPVDDEQINKLPLRWIENSSRNMLYILRAGIGGQPSGYR